jgi:integrase
MSSLKVPDHLKDRPEYKTAIDIIELTQNESIPKPKTVSHAAIIEPMAFGALLRAIDGYQGGPVATSALKLAPLVFLRPGELRHAEWSEIDLDAGLWVVPEAKTKMRQALTVPLSQQAREILEHVKPFSGHGRYVFPSNRGQGKPMSENTINAALRGLGYGPDIHVGHGFRASARTMLDQELKFDVRFIEMQLGHMVKDANGSAYNRTSFIHERTLMMQAWADYLDSLRTGAKIIDFDRKAA